MTITVTVAESSHARSDSDENVAGESYNLARPGGAEFENLNRLFSFTEPSSTEPQPQPPRAKKNKKNKITIVARQFTVLKSRRSSSNAPQIRNKASESYKSSCKPLDDPEMFSF